MSSLDSSGQELSRDDHTLDLARALADGHQLDVAEILLGGIVLHESVAAMNLDAVLGNPHRHLARIQLRHRRLERRPMAAVLEERGAIREPAGGLDAGGGVGELPLNRLKA